MSRMMPTIPKKTAVFLVACLAVTTACSDDKTDSPTAPTARLSAPAIDSPADNQLVNSLRPVLVVVNGVSPQAGARTYEFQVSNNSGFSSTLFTRQNVAEGPGKTSVTVDIDLPPPTTYYWRSRMTQGNEASDWVSAKFTTKQGGYNRPGELLDLLTDGFTVGERVGSTTFVAGRGIRIDNANSYVRYQLPATVSSGEFSMEVEGLGPNGPRNKQAIFAMGQGTGTITNNPFEMFAQYRGTNGNPDNCVTFKAVWGSTAYKLEFDAAGRASAVMNLDPSTTYFWRGSWTPTSYRLLVKAGGVNGATIYDRTITAPGGGPYAPSPHVAYIGSNSGAFVTDDGSFTGMVVRNVWLGSGSRPAMVR
ncbi:MAG: hypothetical protein EHM24_00290 [Acidobacteria bacterium]|nr:MAG: hypothetical protein EHM24_00290 [Acidobacteriota bacterium]